MKYKSFIKVLFALNVLNTINANENDVHFDFNKYFRVNIATNKPTELAVTLYNPHKWPGPNDTHPTLSTTAQPSPPKRRFAFGLRRSAVEFRNRGYGYEDKHNTTQNLNNPSFEATISPNRKFINFGVNYTTNQYNPDTIQEFRGFRNLSRDFHISRNFSGRFPFNQNVSVYSSPPIIRRRIIPTFINTTKRPTKWQIFPTNVPQFNFSRDLGDFQDILPKNFTKFKNYSSDFNPFQPPVVNQSLSSSFICNKMPYFGYYADIETDCKIFHMCTPDGLQSSFVCPLQLRFNQMLTVCDWSRNVDCYQSRNYYDINLIKFDHWNRQFKR